MTAVSGVRVLVDFSDKGVQQVQERIQKVSTTCSLGTQSSAFTFFNNHASPTA
jgi:hypothetical protein